MGNSSMAGLLAGSVRFDAGGPGLQLGQTSRSEDQADQLNADKRAVLSLLLQLEAADKSGMKPMEQRLLGELKDLRSKLGDDKYKAILEQIKNEVLEGWLARMRRLYPELFSDDEPSPSPSPGPSPRGGVGRVNPGGFGPSTSMSNIKPTQGAEYYHYKPDASDPGKKPGTGREPGNIWSGFRQGPDGNCVTVSAIKSAMMQFGQKPTDVYKSVKETASGYEVVMRDSNKVYSLTKDELKTAARHAQFNGDNPAMMTDANFMYAMSAKRAQVENNDGVAGRSYEHALNSLNDGEFSREGLDRLGLKNNYRQASAGDFKNGYVGTVENGGHSMAVIGNHIELWGKKGGPPAPGIYTVLFS